jgi:spore germination cell wall hydrolase CwlJ-like protein
MPLSELWEVFETAMVALTLWREGRGEGELAMRAIACSIRNRVNRPSWWGNDYGTVVTKRLQYSSMTAPGDPQLVRYPDAMDSEFAVALELADALVSEDPMDNPVPHADSFFDVSIPAPSWASPDIFIKQIGRIRFYNVDRDFEIEKTGPVPAVAEGLKPVQPPEKSWWKKLWG